MLGEVISIGRVKRKKVDIDAVSEDFEDEFSKSMAWIDENIEVLSMTNVLIKSYENRLREEYLIVYRKIERKAVKLRKIQLLEGCVPISEKLKNARKENEITQTQLAKDLNLSVSHIGNIEANIRGASKEIAKKLSEYFNTDVEYWF